ncbi:hypothetical protein LCGC14_0386940 [marine sediment metagenome]|uniref:Uncharacterized protein n=1 Tax=marine sediment metagenome TaxID=412755 RepID=A0A0F9VMX3_9ZZZZ
MRTITLTLERRNPDGKMWQKTYVVLHEGPYGFDLQELHSKKLYTAVRNQQTADWITVLDGKGGVTFQGMIV